MAGTFNNTTGYIDVNGVYTGEIVVNGKYSIDSDWVLSLIGPEIASQIHLDSDQVQAIANTVRLNDLIDSDHISTIAAATLASTVTQVATNTTNIAANTTAIVNNDSDILALGARITTNATNIATNVAAIAAHELRIDQHDSDIAALALTPGNITAVEFRVTSLENNDTAQDASITGNATDIAALKTFTGEGVTLTTAATALSGAVNELDAEIGDINNFVGVGSFAATDVSLAIAELLTNQTALQTAATNLEARVATLETLVNALIARVGGGSTPFALNDLADVTTGTPTTGQQLTWNGTDWTAANDQT